MAPPQESDPLVVGSLFNYRNRKPVDVPWGILYLIFLALTLAGGIYGISNRYILFREAGSVVVAMVIQTQSLQESSWFPARQYMDLRPSRESTQRSQI